MQLRLQHPYLEESRRQQTAALRTAVVCLAAGEPAEGLTQLERAGMVREIGSAEARQSALVHDYMARSPEARKQTLILSGTNVERLALTSALRTALQAEGDLGQDTFTLRSLRSQDRTIAQLKYACAYEVGDVVVPVKDYRRYGMKRREQYTVLSRDLAGNRLTLQAPDGQPFLFNPTTCTAKTTYAVQKIAIAPGEQLRWTRNEAVKGVRNGQLVTVEKIDAQGTATVRNGKGDTMTLDLTGQQYLDYALVSTTYRSQGKTADQVLATIDSTVSKEGLYVAVSRAKRKLKLYTADKAQLYQKAERSSAQANPSDYLPLFEMVNSDAPTPQTARVIYRRHRAESIGNSLGERVRESRGPTLRRGGAAASRREQLESSAERTRRATERVSRATAEISQTTEHFSGGIRAAEAASQRAATAAIEQLEAINQRTRQRAKWLSNRRLYQSVYQHYASIIHHDSPQERERLIAEQLVSDRLQQKGKQFGQQDVAKVRLVFLQGPISQRLKHTQGREVAWQYADKTVKQELKTIQKQQARDQGMSM